MDQRDPFAVLVEDTDDDVIVIDDDGDAVRLVGGRPRAADGPSGAGQGQRPRKKAASRSGGGAAPRPGGGGGSGERPGSGGGGSGGGGAGGGGGGGGRPPKQPPPVDDAKATQRGIVVIVVTVLVGVLVFWLGINRPAENTSLSAQVPTAPNTTTRNDAPPVTQPLPATTAPAPPATSVAPAQVKVLVANGVDPAKVIAGPVVAKLADKGYTQASAVDLTSAVATSAVYYSEGLESDAQAIAAIVGFPSSSVAAMPAKPPATLNGAKVLVVVGQDQG